MELEEARAEHKRLSELIERLENAPSHAAILWSGYTGRDPLGFGEANDISFWEHAAETLAAHIEAERAAVPFDWDNCVGEKVTADHERCVVLAVGAPGTDTYDVYRVREGETYRQVRRQQLTPGWPDVTVERLS